MAHEIAKLMLEHAGSFLERAEAIETAVYLGMPLHEIEAYLDWLDSVKSASGEKTPGGEPLKGPHGKGRKPRQPRRGVS